jgi:hypothetical protein
MNLFASHARSAAPRSSSAAIDKRRVRSVARRPTAIDRSVTNDYRIPFALIATVHIRAVAGRPSRAVRSARRSVSIPNTKSGCDALRPRRRRRRRSRANCSGGARSPS